MKIKTELERRLYNALHDLHTACETQSKLDEVFYWYRQDMLAADARQTAIDLLTELRSVERESE